MTPVTPGSKGRRGQQKRKVYAEIVKRASGGVERKYTASSVMFHFVWESALKLSTQRKDIGWWTKIQNSVIFHVCYRFVVFIIIIIIFV